MMNVDPAVRSIRVAAALSERFGAILNAPPEVDSADELEQRIGEAQRLYPEIWRHLDDARSSLQGRGIEVVEYDRLRGNGAHQLGVGGIDTRAGFTGGFGSVKYTVERTASFNEGGWEKAREARQALMNAMPEVNWRELAQQEKAQIDAIGSLTPDRRWLYVAAAAGIGIVLLLVWFVIIPQFSLYR
jgi:hypothetical protein